MKKITLITAFVLLSSFIYSQKKISIPTFKNDSIQFFYKFFNYEMEKRAKAKFFDSICVQNLTFLKFRIDKNGKPIDIEFNHESDTFLNNIYKEIIVGSAQYWKPSIYKKKPVVSKQIIIPIIVFYDAACKRDLNSYKNVFLSFKKAIMRVTSYTNDKSHKAFIDDCIILENFFIVDMDSY